jgi:hypothetical protein
LFAYGLTVGPELHESERRGNILERISEQFGPT